MITKERFIKIMNADGINTKTAKELWERNSETIEEFHSLPDEVVERVIHVTNEIMLSSAPPGVLMSYGN